MTTKNLCFNDKTWTTLSGGIVRHMWPNAICPNCKNAHIKYDENGDMVYGKCYKK